MNLPVVHACRLHPFEAVRPGRRVDVAHSVADPFLFRIEFDMMTGRNLESNPLTGRFELSGRNVIYFAAEGRDRLG